MAAIANDDAIIESGSDSEAEGPQDLSDGAILDKYKAAAGIVNKTLQGIIDTQVKDGASVGLGALMILFGGPEGVMMGLPQLLAGADLANKSIGTSKCGRVGDS